MNVLPITVNAEIAEELHAQLREIVDKLNTTARHPEYGSAPGLRDALSTILHAVRDLDVAVLPSPAASLPTDGELGWVQPLDKLRGCSVLLGIEFDVAQTLTEEFLASSQRLNRVLGEIQKRLPSRKAPPDLVSRFAFVMGYLFTEVCMPLYRKYPELEPAWLRE